MAVVETEQVAEALNLSDISTHAIELELYIAAATEHVEARTGPLPSAEHVERAKFHNGMLVTRFFPILSVASIADDHGTEYSTEFTVGNAGYSFTHATVTSGWWTVTYTAGWETVPASLQLAAISDIRGLYGATQLGTSAGFGFGNLGVQQAPPGFGPVGLWPRIDRWLAANVGPSVA